MKILTLLVTLALAALLFRALERRWPRRPGLRTDLAYWFINPFITRPLAGGAAIVAVVLAAGATGVSLSAETGLAPLIARSPIAGWPVWLQAASALLLADLLGYWLHRAFHRGRLWRIHAIHHSSERLDWLSSVRVHPLNAALARPLQLTPLLLLGFDPTALAGVAPLLGLWGVVVHADVGWRFGALEHLIATPAFHRWHHARDADCNFAGLFPLWDRVFGTLYLPDAAPTDFGVRGERVPEGVWGQLMYPLHPGRQQIG